MAELAMISSAKLRLPLCQEEISSLDDLQSSHQQIQQWLSCNLSTSSARHDNTDGALSTEIVRALDSSTLREVNS